MTLRRPIAVSRLTSVCSQRTERNQLISPASACNSIADWTRARGRRCCRHHSRPFGSKNSANQGFLVLSFGPWFSPLAGRGERLRKASLAFEKRAGQIRRTDRRAHGVARLVAPPSLDRDREDERRRAKMADTATQRPRAARVSSAAKPATGARTAARLARSGSRSSRGRRTACRRRLGT